MISCTEFIPAYSELFSYLDQKYGRKEVDRFWEYLFAPTGDGIPLINFVKKEGIRGCFSYWSGTLNEEAADFTMYLNEKAGWFHIAMHKCPSKGRLLKLAEEKGIVPYKDYCLHCFCYRSALEKVGLEYIYNFTGVDQASCGILVYDPKVFNGQIVVDEDTVVMDRKASENEYFHPDFHSSMNMGIHYLGEKYGLDDVEEYLRQYTRVIYRDTYTAQEPLKAVESLIRDTYEKEHALDALTIEASDKQLRVRVAYCPAVRHLQATGRQVSVWYPYTTQTVMAELAALMGLQFVMVSYDAQSGAAEYSFNTL